MLYLPWSYTKAAPKGISGRTSYLQVRLAFHLYPQLIRAFCNRRRFGPPRALTRASAWPWIAHLVSGRPPATPRPLQTRVRSGSGCHSLSLATDGHSPVHSPIGTPSRGHPRSDSLEADGFRFSFTPLAGVLFTCPSRYSCTIGRLRYLALEGGPPSFPRDSTCPAVLTHPCRATPPSPTGLSPAPVARSSSVRLVVWLLTRCRRCHVDPGAVQPPPDIGRQTTQSDRFRLLPFRSPLLRESSLFLEVLRCFSSPTYLHTAYRFSGGSLGITPAGLPHSETLGSLSARNSPRRFVAWPRPSSASDAKASTVCSSRGRPRGPSSPAASRIIARDHQARRHNRERPPQSCLGQPTWSRHRAFPARPPPSPPAPADVSCHDAFASSPLVNVRRWS